MQLKYCQKLDFEAGPNSKIKPLIKHIFDLKSIRLSFLLYRNQKMPKMDFEASPEY